MALKGFFGAAEVRSAKVRRRTPACGVCGLKDKCRSPKMPVYGRGRRGILVVGEAPGETEDARNRPFVGKSGQRLRESLTRCGVDMDEDCWAYNSVICRPVANATPTDNQLNYCRPNLLNLIDDLKPKVILLLGGTAVQSLIGYLWQDSRGGKSSGITRWAGWQIPCQRYNCWVCPTFHPSYVLRATEDVKKTPNGPVVALSFDRHVEAAAARRKRPWNPVPDYKGMVELVENDSEAATRLRKYAGGTVVFDYETTTLKPDGPHAEIVCCSVCWEGQEAICFPWRGKAKAAMAELLANRDVAKAGQNVKFEIRWSLAKLGVFPSPVIHDTMLYAHGLDSRAAVTGLKFQAFARLGFEDYSSHVQPYLEGKGGNGPNRIRELDWPTIGLYCGLDSVIEYELMRVQRGELIL